MRRRLLIGAGRLAAPLERPIKLALGPALLVCLLVLAPPADERRAGPDGPSSPSSHIKVAADFTQAKQQQQQQQQQHSEPQTGTSGFSGKRSTSPTTAATSLEPVIPPQLSSREVEKAIVDRILGEGYDKRIRPAGSGAFNTSKPGEFRPPWRAAQDGAAAGAAGSQPASLSAAHSEWLAHKRERPAEQKGLEIESRAREWKARRDH
jgi:hypothetical protein